MGKYDDIIGLPHHVSATRPHMPMIDRAAQFMPFRALTGYEGAVQETARLTDQKIELSGDEKAALDMKLQRLVDNLGSQPPVTLVYFRPDEKKSGGAYVTAAGRLKKIDQHMGVLILTGGERIPIEDIFEIR